MESGRGCKKSQQSWIRIRRCWTVVEIFSVILTAVFMLVVVKEYLLHNTECEVESSSRRILTDESTKRLESICNVTLYSDQCYSTLMSVNPTDPRVLFRASMVTAVEEHVKILGFLSKLVSSDESVKSSLKVCDEMIVDALECLKETIERFDEFGKAMNVDINEIRGTLTYAIIDEETCLEGFDEVMEFDFSSYQRNIELIKSLRGYMKKGKEIMSNSLAIVTKILGGLAKKVDENLLGSSNMVESLMSCHLTPNVTVAKDGTGNYRTISEAMASIPENSKSRFVIHVKEGQYFENVNVTRNKYNVVVYGDGITKTIVSSNLNRHEKPKISTTFQTATFSVSARWFVVRDMTFVNTAGPKKEQAVAFHSDAKHSVMYRCAFKGFQDTLYARAGRHLYKDCDIVGTVDFIFGRAAAVFQNCTIRPQQPLPSQFNTITAQAGVDDANTISGFSIVNSNIYPYQEDLTVKTYLGRPWNAYSTVVVMKKQIEKLIDPNGWVSWDKKLTPPTTITYGGYMNYGPGSAVDNRVKWIGYKPKMTDQEAHKYTVDALINHNG